MDTLTVVKRILGDALSLGARADGLSIESRLLGSIPEFDSMAVVTVLGAIEDELGCSIDDDEVSAEVFATVGSLVEFVESKSGHRG